MVKSMMLKCNIKTMEYFLFNYGCHLTSLENSEKKDNTTVITGYHDYSKILQKLLDDGHYINMIGKKPIKNKKIDDPTQWCVMQTPNHEWFVLRSL